MADFASGDWKSGDWSGAGGSTKFSWWAWTSEVHYGMFKNVASQKITLLAIDTATNLPKTGDSANITPYLKKDGGSVTALTDTSATEDDATNAPGQYTFDVSQSESNADWIEFTAKSSTSGIRIVPKTVYTFPTTGILAPTTANRTLDVSAGGEVGLDWANVGSPTTTVNLSGTTIKTATDIAAQAVSDLADVLAALGGIVGQGKYSVGDTGNDATHIHLTSLTYSDDEINDWLICIYDTSAAEYHWRWILDFVGSSRLALVAALPFTPVDTDFFWLLGARRDVDAVRVGGQTASAAATVTFPATIASTTNITAGTITTATNVTTVNGLAANVITATSIAADAITAGKIAADAIGASELAADAATEIATAVWAATTRRVSDATNITSDASAITMSSSGVVGTVNLANTLTTYTGNTVQTGDSYAIVNSGTHGNAAIKGYVDDIGVAGAGLTAIPTMTTAMTESYNADGAAPTPAQALFFLMQMFSEITFSSTTATIKKLDGSTTAYTLTLNDASTPTSITRAT